MQSLSADEIRSRYLDYFAERGHLVLPSAPLVPYEDDPSVLLTIAGMQPLKSYFLGAAEPPRRRLASCQKCFRTLDIDDVGRTARHLTFFEMLGNFSIGDYFKDDAIRFGFELSTDVLGLDPEQIWITVFEGSEGVPADEEAVERWVEMGIPRERIQALGESENFWRLGPTGPCGPNSELYLDRGEAFGPPGGPAVGGDRFLEYWNLVFMQYERSADGTLAPLPSQCIDTGAGLERIAAILQGKQSVFDTDAFRPLIGWAEARSGRRYGAVGRDDRALRVLADHGRAMTFLAADGVRPGNEGRDYILRRIIRRAVSEASHLGLEPAALVDLSAQVVAGFGEAYPELVERAADVTDAVGAEAEQFARTLAQGQRLLSEVIQRSLPTRTVTGDDAFRLYDTYGFPLDLTLEAAEEAGVAVDVPGFERLMGDQRQRARSAARRGGDAAGDRAEAFALAAAPSTFVGYDEWTVATRVTALQRLEDAAFPVPEPSPDLALDGEAAAPPWEALVKLERSPFYAQGGGQVSDAGVLEGDRGRAEVLDVYRVGDDQALRVRVYGELAVGDEVQAAVDAPARRATQGNHTATHLLHWALREELGTGVRQAGSYVGPDKLRFDFTHRGRVPAEQLARIEARVNQRVAEDAAVRVEVMDRDAAGALGAIGLFEEKYGERVRVVAAGDYSRELCGGTHVSRTGEIGPFVLASEASIGASARRVEALTGPGAIAWYRERQAALEADLAQRDARIRELEADLVRARRRRVDVQELAGAATSVDGLRLLAAEVEAADAEDLLAVSDRLRQALGSGAAVVLGARADDRAMLVANFDPEAVAAGLSAAAVIREIAPLVGGGGGGRESMARAGGKDPARLPQALAAAEEALRRAAGRDTA
ncbi:MAG: alanyl-tRNA synthetase [Miltoncostaeaceae bacterium]|jgi:alanyl-tRNA synthetase|nr:alanyl-tRNA synthetase [Miltoncostaeaceae bacterium]